MKCFHDCFQFNLFGGTVLKLGTERHHKVLLEGIDNLQDIGCFGLTELGYGNNAVEMETTAVYDEETKEFIVNTPHPLAQKYWITNGAVHAKHVVVSYFSFRPKTKIPELLLCCNIMCNFVFSHPKG